MKATAAYLALRVDEGEGAALASQVDQGRGGLQVLCQGQGGGAGGDQGECEEVHLWLGFLFFGWLCHRLIGVEWLEGVSVVGFILLDLGSSQEACVHLPGLARSARSSPDLRGHSGRCHVPGRCTYIGVHTHACRGGRTWDCYSQTRFRVLWRLQSAVNARQRGKLFENAGNCEAPTTIALLDFPQLLASHVRETSSSTLFCVQKKSDRRRNMLSVCLYTLWLFSLKVATGVIYFHSRYKRLCDKIRQPELCCLQIFGILQLFANSCSDIVSKVFGGNKKLLMTLFHISQLLGLPASQRDQQPRSAPLW